MNTTQGTNSFQQEIARVALGWADRGCRETVTNGGSCIDEIHELFGAPRRESYCAKLAWVVVEQAAHAIGIRNPLPKVAGACSMLQDSVKMKLRVDKHPAMGSIFYRTTDAQATGHVGVVIAVTETTVQTVEGNSKDRIGRWEYPIQKVLARPVGKCQRGNGWDFIHIEDMGGAPGIPSGQSPAAGAPSTGGPSTGMHIGSRLVIAGFLVGGFVAVQHFPAFRHRRK